MDPADVDTLLATLEHIRDALVWLTWGIGFIAGMITWRIIQEAMTNDHNGIFGGDGQQTIE